MVRASKELQDFIKTGNVEQFKSSKVALDEIGGYTPKDGGHGDSPLILCWANLMAPRR